MSTWSLRECSSQARRVRQTLLLGSGLDARPAAVSPVFSLEVFLSESEDCIIALGEECVVSRGIQGCLHGYEKVMYRKIWRELNVVRDCKNLNANL